MTKYLYYPFVVLGRAIMHPVDYVGRIRKLCRDFRLPYDLMRRIVKLGGEEYRDEVDFISRQKSPRWFPFPYPAVRDEMARVNAFVKDGLPAIRHKTKDLFFRRTTSLREVRRQYRTFIDQEGITGCGCLAKCPHNYQSAEHRVEKGDVLLDIGCSEAIFTLDNLEKVSEAYVFEADEEWKEPLSHTFPVDKVHVVTKFVGDKTGGMSVRVTDIVPSRPDATYFIKMDIEGNERIVLNSMKEFLTANRVKISCCVYHCQDDAEYIQQLLSSLGFQTCFSDGWMVPIFGEIREPYFRRGVIYARNYQSTSLQNESK